MSAPNLLEWAGHYLRARDAMERKLKSLDTLPDKLVAHYKDRDVTFFAEQDLTAKHASASGVVTIVTLQKKANFDVLVQQFSTFAQNANLTIIFVNPKLNEKWLIKPSVHVAVADKSSLKTGLSAMFETVPVV